jgi:release factor glutamine methyltransferase
MGSDSPVTVAGLFEEATLRLRAAGVVKPRREANRLWAWLSRTSVGESYLGRDPGAPAERVEAFRAAVTRRAAGEPLAYVLGRSGFRNLDLLTDRRALIPRPETEGMIDYALERVTTGRAVDLGTGTGCLALALAEEGSFELVVGVDVSAAALALAQENARLTRLPARFVRSDLGCAFESGRFDLVVANPPYLSDAEYEALDPAVKAWEPRSALAGGADGLEIAGRIFAHGLDLLTPGGWIVMELDSTRSAAAAELARRAGWTRIDVWDDLFGRPRYLTARRSYGND